MFHHEDGMDMNLRVSIGHIDSMTVAAIICRVSLPVNHNTVEEANLYSESDRA